MRRTSAKPKQPTGGGPNTPDNQRLALEALESFISYFNIISELKGDGMIRVAGKQASISDFERLTADSTLKLLSEKDNITEFNFADFYNQSKVDALYGNKYISAKPSASIQCRAKPSEMGKAYGTDVSQLNYRQLILLNNVLFEAGMDLMTKYKMNHDQLTPVFAEAFKGIDFNKMGMSNAGDNQPAPEIMPALQRRVAAITESIAERVLQQGMEPARSISEPLKGPKHDDAGKRRFSLFSPNRNAAQQPKNSVEVLKSEVQMISDAMQRQLNMMTTKEGGAGVEDMKKFKLLGRQLAEKQKQLSDLEAPKIDSPRKK